MACCLEHIYTKLNPKMEGVDKQKKTGMRITKMIALVLFKSAFLPYLSLNAVH